jgi:hypothetical protein
MDSIVIAGNTIIIIIIIIIYNFTKIHIFRELECVDLFKILIYGTKSSGVHTRFCIAPVVPTSVRSTVKRAIKRQRCSSRISLSDIQLSDVLYCQTLRVEGSGDSSVGIATDYGLDDRGSIPGRARYFSVLHSAQANSGTHPASSPLDTGGSFRGGKAAGLGDDHLPPSSAKVKNGGSIPPLLHTYSWRNA